MGGKLQIVVDGQYGSSGKGHVAGYLAKYEYYRGRDVLAVRVAGPNAGHSVWGTDATGEPKEFKLRHVPTAAVTVPSASLALAAGSEVDGQVLADELALLDACGYFASERLKVDRNATLLTPEHIKMEVEDGLQERLGSTAKGVGAARSERIWRRAATWGGGVDVARMIRESFWGDCTVLIEGTQGYGLGLHTDNYPFTTSSDCRAIDFLSMAGVSPWSKDINSVEPWVVFRTRPIRVAGNSGALKDETSWLALDLPEERTTVTNKVRRVGAWDSQLARAAVDANGGGDAVYGALMMLDQVFPWLSGWEIEDWMSRTDEQRDQVESFLDRLQRDADCFFHLLGTSPSTVIDRRRS